MSTVDHVDNTPSAADALYPNFVGRNFETPGAQHYSTFDSGRWDGEYFAKPIQDELLKHQDVLNSYDSVLTKTADYPIVAADLRKTFTNNGASGQVILTLPAATVGRLINFYVHTAQNLRALSVGTDVVRVGADLGIAASYIECATVGSWLTLRCIVAGTWSGTQIVGPWAVQTS